MMDRIPSQKAFKNPQNCIIFPIQMKLKNSSTPQIQWQIKSVWSIKLQFHTNENFKIISIKKLLNSYQRTFPFLLFPKNNERKVD